MQQSFTPQFSPTLTMQQASPGAAVQAAPVQTASPAQMAEPAISEPAPTGYPAMAPSAPAEPYTPLPGIPEPDPGPGPMIPADWPSSPELERAIMTEREKGFPWLPVAAAAAVGLFLFTRQPKKGT